MNSNWKKFKLLMWKNWIPNRRNLIAQIFSPTSFLILLAVIKNMQNIGDLHDGIYLPENPLILSDAEINKSISSLAYSPCNTYIQAILEKIDKINFVKEEKKIVCFPSAKVLEEKLINNATNYFAGIVFDDKYIDNRTLDSKISIQFRFYSNVDSKWNTDVMYPDCTTAVPRSVESNTTVYYKQYFLGLQIIITKALIKQTTTNNPINFPIILTNKFPFVPHYNSIFFHRSMFLNLGANLYALSIYATFSYFVNFILIEKENQLKESLKIMGLPGWLQLLALFVHFFAYVLIHSSLILLFKTFKLETFFKHSDNSVLFVYFTLYGCSMITLGFLITTLVSKSSTGAVIAGVALSFSMIPYLILPQSTSFNYRLASSLVSLTSFEYGFNIAMQFEALGKGIQWSNIFSTIRLGETLTFGSFLLMLLLDTFIYLLIALYFEQIFPGDFGIPQPWYFPFTLTYWRGNKILTETGNDYDVIQHAEFIEESNKRLPVKIQLKNLSKIIGANQVVKQVNLEMYKGQIFVLLGHNGAGKSITLSMITGMIPPTSGTAIVEGYDVRTNIHYVRESMGLCLQHNVLFDELTVQEHLIFFASLKGLPKSEAQRETDYYIQFLELEHKRDCISSTLSGGMKRKLSVAISLCGNSKVIILDEPTAGMDPPARRNTWKLLQQKKTNCTILLTTHFMDEADILGDQIAIMVAGEIKCVGSSFSLKKKYGTGYHLIIDVHPTCDANNVTALLRKYISTIKIESHIGSELSYLLLESDSTKFETMLHDLEQNCKQLKINSYGISLTTLEEVFMKVGVDYKDLLPQDLKTVFVEPSTRKLSLVRGKQLILNQIQATLLKKYIFMLRSWILFVFQFCSPLFFFMTNIFEPNNSKDYVPLKMTLDLYTDSITLLSGNTKNNYYNMYKTLPGKTVVQEVANISNSVSELLEKDINNVLLHYIVGASFVNDTCILAWYNDEYYHTAPLALQLVLNAILAYHKPNSSIEFVNNPFPLKNNLKTKNKERLFDISHISTEFGLSLSFVASFYILLCVKDRVSKSKHLQFVSGMNNFVYWGTTFLWDLITYLIIFSCVLIIIPATRENFKEGFTSFDGLGRLSLLLICFGLCVLPNVYLNSRVFKFPSTGFLAYMAIGIIGGDFLPMVLQIIKNNKYLYTYNILHYCLLVSPFYSTSKGIDDLKKIYNHTKTCATISLEFCNKDSTNVCCNAPKDYFSFGTLGIGLNVLTLLIISIITSFFILENRFSRKILDHLKKFCIYKKTKIIIKPLKHVDEDVLQETTKIKSCTKEELSETYVLALDDLTKHYRKFVAVNKLCLGVQPFECFGLLGVNGAGKTTTFKMLTGDETISSGNAWTNGISLKDNLKDGQKFIGYCPQFDALLDYLTVRESLKMFALIRGVPSCECNTLAENLAHQFYFHSQLNKEIKSLSGGNKRKLSTATALIGDPQVIYLDEPTAGMDPASKRFVWQALCKIRESGKTIILTSQSMEECQALCTRLAIMVNGSFQCLGSKQQLKDKFAQEYKLTIKLKSKIDSADLEHELTQVKNFIEKEFPGSTLKDSHMQMLNYTILSKNNTWSQIFGKLERNKGLLNIEDYSIQQGSLEEVFLNFTQPQN